MKKRIKLIITMLLMIALITPCVIPINSGVVEAASKTSKKKYKLNKTKLTMYEWGTYQLKLNGVEDNYYVSWKSSDSDGLVVYNDKQKAGLIYAKKVGSYTVSGYYKNKTYKCKVTVKYQPKGIITGNSKRENQEYTWEGNCDIFIVPKNEKFAKYTKKDIQNLREELGEKDLDNIYFIHNIQWGSEKILQYKKQVKAGAYLLIAICNIDTQTVRDLNDDSKIVQYLGVENTKALSEAYGKRTYEIQEVTVKDKQTTTCDIIFK